MAVVVGIDFGISNSVVAVCQADGRVTTGRFAFGAVEVDVFHSLLCF
jgi:molecular chaperone DnaK (HSP70)